MTPRGDSSGISQANQVSIIFGVRVRTNHNDQGGEVSVSGFACWCRKRGTWQGGQGRTGPASAIYGGVRGRGVLRVGAGGRAQQGSWWRGRVGIDKDRTRPPRSRNSASKGKRGEGERGIGKGAKGWSLRGTRDRPVRCGAKRGPGVWWSPQGRALIASTWPLARS